MSKKDEGVWPADDDSDGEEEEEGEKKWDYTDSILFTNNLEDAKKTPEYPALQALLYDEPPNEVALNFKEQGNDQFSRKRYRDAVVFYTKGIETPKVDDVVLLCQLRNNRAQCHIILSNFGKCIEDCQFVLSHEPQNVKALFRVAKAHLHLRHFAKCIAFCKAGILACAPEDSKLTKAKKTFEQILKKADAMLTKERDRERSQASMPGKREAFLAKRGIKVSRRLEFEVPMGSSSSASEMLVVDSDTSELYFRVTFLYDEFRQSDVIERFWEGSTMMSQLETLLQDFPYAGDYGRKHYRPAAVKVFFVSLGGDSKKMKLRHVVEVEKTETLRDVLRSSEYFLPRDLGPVFHVVLRKDSLDS